MPLDVNAMKTNIINSEHGVDQFKPNATVAQRSLNFATHQSLEKRMHRMVALRER